MGFGKKKKRKEFPEKRFCLSMHVKNKESFNRAQSFLKKEGGRIFLGMRFSKGGRF